MGFPTSGLKIGKVETIPRKLPPFLQPVREMNREAGGTVFVVRQLKEKAAGTPSQSPQNGLRPQYGGITHNTLVFLALSITDSWIPPLLSPNPLKGRSLFFFFK